MLELKRKAVGLKKISAILKRILVFEKTMEHKSNKNNRKREARPNKARKGRGKKKSKSNFKRILYCFS